MANGEIPSRYSRQLLFPGIGSQGQAKLLKASVALVGCGALGTTQASLLVRAGVKRLRIIDRDFVEESNLQRQILFDENDVRSMLPKAVAAEQKLRQVNSLVQVEGVVEDVNRGTIGRLLDGFDIVLDATDNFEARFLVNDYCVKNAIPWVYGAVVGAHGITFPIVPGETACLACIFESAPPPELAPSCDTAGVIGPIAATIASLQAAEALKLLSGQRDKLSRQIRILDLWENEIRGVDLAPPQSDCVCCGKREFRYLEAGEGSEATTLCGRNSVQIYRPGARFDLDAIAKRLSPLGNVEKNRFLLRAKIEAYELTVFPDGRAIIGGTHDPAIAKSVYARYLGS